MSDGCLIWIQIAQQIHYYFHNSWTSSLFEEIEHLDYKEKCKQVQINTFMWLLVSESTESKKRFYWDRMIKPKLSRKSEY